MIEKKKKWKLADFDYPLPEKYIAQYPAKRRDLSKLMVVHKETGEIEHKIFSNLPDYLRKNDLVITNNTKVFPARLYASMVSTNTLSWESMATPGHSLKVIPLGSLAQSGTKS